MPQGSASQTLLRMRCSHSTTGWPPHFSIWAPTPSRPGAVSRSARTADCTSASEGGAGGRCGLGCCFLDGLLLCGRRLQRRGGGRDGRRSCVAFRCRPLHRRHELGRDGRVHIQHRREMLRCCPGHQVTHHQFAACRADRPQRRLALASKLVDQLVRLIEAVVDQVALHLPQLAVERGCPVLSRRLPHLRAQGPVGGACRCQLGRVPVLLHQLQGRLARFWWHRRGLLSQLLPVQEGCALVPAYPQRHISQPRLAARATRLGSDGLQSGRRDRGHERCELLPRVCCRRLLPLAECLRHLGPEGCKRVWLQPIEMRPGWRRRSVTADARLRSEAQLQVSRDNAVV